MARGQNAHSKRQTCKCKLEKKRKQAVTATIKVAYLISENGHLHKVTNYFERCFFLHTHLLGTFPSSPVLLVSPPSLSASAPAP